MWPAAYNVDPKLFITKFIYCLAHSKALVCCMMVYINSWRDVRELQSARGGGLKWPALGGCAACDDQCLKVITPHNCSLEKFGPSALCKIHSKTLLHLCHCRHEYDRVPSAAGRWPPVWPAAAGRRTFWLMPTSLSISRVKGDRKDFYFPPINLKKAGARISYTITFHTYSRETN